MNTQNQPTETQQLNSPGPSIDVVVQVVLNSLPSPLSRKSYHMAIRDFLADWRAQDGPPLNKLYLQTYIASLQSSGTGAGSINLRLAAIRKLACEAAELGVWPDTIAAAFTSVRNIPQRGVRTGNWLSLEQAQRLINTPDPATPKGVRDRAILATLLGCGLRRMELARLRVDHLQLRDGRWVLANLLGKRNRTRTVTVPAWTMQAIEAYLAASGITHGQLFQALNKAGAIQRDGLSLSAVRNVIRRHAATAGLRVSTHDLRRTYAKLALRNGARLEQIQLSLGHDSLATTQRYLGTDLDLVNGPGDFLAIAIDAPDSGVQKSPVSKFRQNRQ